MFEIMLAVDDWKVKKTTVFFRDKAGKEYYTVLPDDGTCEEFGLALVSELNRVMEKVTKGTTLPKTA